MSDSIVREIDLKVVYTDLASGPAKAFEAARQKAVKELRAEQDKSDQAYVRAMLKHLQADKQLAAERVKGIKEAAAEQAKADAAYERAVRAHLKAERQLEDQKAKATEKARRDQEKSQQAYVRAVTKQAAAEKRLEDQKAKAAEKARRDQERATAQAERDKEREERAYVRAVSRQLAAERQLEREKERALQKQQREVEKEERAYVRAVMKKLAAEKQLEDEQKRQKEASDAQTVGVLKMVAAFAGLNSVTGVIHTIADHFDKIRQDAYEAAESVMNMRGAVRELQALRDQMGKTGAGLAHAMAGSAETLQTPEEFKAMELAGLGAGELAIGEGDGKTMARADFEEFMKSAGKMQAMEGGSPEAWGKMAGLIALESKEKLTKEQAEGKLNRMFEIQRPGKFATMTEAIGQYEKMGGLVSTGILTQEEAMGLVTAEATAGNKDEAGTHALQIARAMSAGRLKARGVKLSDDVDAEKMDEYFKALGITDKHTVMQRAAIVSADIAKNTGAGKENATEYLIRHGFGNAEEREAVMGYSGMKNSGKLKMIEDAQNAAPDNGAITRRFEDWRKTDNFAKRRASQMLGESADIKTGLKEEPLVMAQEAAFNRLKAQGKISGTFKEWQGTGTFRAATQDLFGLGYYSQVNREAMHSLEAERKRLNLPAPSVAGSVSSHEYMLRYARSVQEGGGDVTRGVSEDLQAAAKDFREAAKESREAAKELKEAQLRAPMPLVLPPAPPGR